MFNIEHVVQISDKNLFHDKLVMMCQIKLIFRFLAHFSVSELFYSKTGVFNFQNKKIKNDLLVLLVLEMTLFLV